MPSYVFFERERVSVAGKWISLSVALMGLLLVSWTLQAGEGVAPKPSLDPGFAALPAYEVQMRAEPQPNKKSDPHVGDQVLLKIAGIDSSSGSQWKLELPAQGSDLTEQGWAIISDPSSAIQFEVVPLKGGELVLPSLPIKNAQGQTVARTHPFKLTVASSISPQDPKPQEPVPLKPPVSLSYPWWFVIFIGILFLAVLGFAVYRLVVWSRGRKKAVEIKPTGPALSEDELALAALSDIEKQGLSQSGAYKKVYFRISEILKAYIAKRFEFDALESTSREILLYLSRQGLFHFQERFHLLERLFGKLDLVKFTDHLPQMDEPAQVLNEARDFILATRRPKKIEQSGVNPA